MVDDSELLRRYAEMHSETAFAELVQRHLGLVYHAALRRTGGDVHRASDVTQTVFTALARDATKLARHTLLTGWLYTTTRNAAIDVARSEQRRKTREQAAHIMHETFSPATAPADWDRVRPVIDEVLDELDAHEREAVLLRFLEDQPFATVGRKLSVSEDAARMRVDRALDKMRSLLARRGIASTTAALAATLAHEASAATPSGLAASVTGAALANTAAGGGGVAATSFLSTGKLAFGLMSAVAAVSTVGLLIQHRINVRLRAEMESVRQQQVSNAESSPPAGNRAEPGVPRAGMAPVQNEIQPTADEPAQNQLAAGSAGSPGNSAAPMLPAQLLMPVEGRYLALFNQLNLKWEQLNLLNNLLGEKQRLIEETIDALLKEGLIPESNLPTIRRAVVDAQTIANASIRDQLGESVFAQYQKFEKTIPQRNTVEQLERSLRGSSAPLTEEQADRMIDILALTHEPDGGGGLGRLLDGGATYHSRISAQTVNMAASILSETQLHALERLRRNQRGVR